MNRYATNGSVVNVVSYECGWLLMVINECGL